MYIGDCEARPDGNAMPAGTIGDVRYASVLGMPGAENAAWPIGKQRSATAHCDQR